MLKNYMAQNLKFFLRNKPNIDKNLNNLQFLFRKTEFWLILKVRVKGIYQIGLHIDFESTMDIILLCSVRYLFQWKNVYKRILVECFASIYKKTTIDKESNFVPFENFENRYFSPRHDIYSRLQKYIQKGLLSWKRFYFVNVKLFEWFWSFLTWVM